MPNVLPGWQAPMYQATGSPPMTWGVPTRFLIILMLVSLVLWFVSWKALLVPGGLYAITACGCMWEPYWGDMLLEYVTYALYYEA